jgi:peptidoglycan/LPS O-acetylase OafA/YrhL
MLAAENDYYDDDIYEKNCGLYILMTFSCTNTWFFYPWGQPYSVNPISIVGWTVNTLFFFYLTFPTLLKLLKPLSDKSIARLIVLLCLFQSIPFYLVWEFYSADPKVNVTVKSRGCLKIGIEVLIIDYICYFLI